MARQCTICHHPDRFQIELLKVGGASLETLATRFDLGEGGRDRLWRHMKNHVKQEDRALYLADIPLVEMAQRAAEEGTSLLDHMRIVRLGLMQLFVAAASAGRGHEAANVATRLMAIFRQLGELTGELVKATPTVNHYNTMVLINSPFFVEVQQMLLDRLQTFPEARAAVVAGLLELDLRHKTPSPPTIEYEGADVRAA